MLYVTEKRHQTTVTRFFHFGPLPVKTSGYASVPGRHMLPRNPCSWWTKLPA